MKYCLRNSAYFPYYHNVRKVQKRLELLFDMVKTAPDFGARLLYANAAANYAMYHPCGYFALPVLENVYLEAARKIDDVECHPESGTILHVLTEAFKTGGHTRVVERWIQLSKSEEKHSVVVIDQKGAEWPVWLKDASEQHGGEFTVFEPMELMARAKKLREYASNFEKIVLHVTMDDGTPIIAFGVDSFTNPIIFFNHADHLSWLGISVSDVVADIRHWDFSEKRRGVLNAKYLGIPPALQSEIGVELQSKEELRNRFGIPEEAFVIVTTASAYKLRGFGKIHYLTEIKKLCKKHSNTFVFVIGVKDEGEWNNANVEYNGRIRPMGVISDKLQYYSCLKMADLYLGSFPFASFTAMMDAVQMGLPFIQLTLSKQKYKRGLDKNELTSPCWVYSLRSLHCTIELSMTDDSFRKELFHYSQLMLKENSDAVTWNERLYGMYAKLPKKHEIRVVPENIEQVFVDDFVASDLIQNNYESVRVKSRILRQFAYWWTYLVLR